MWLIIDEVDLKGLIAQRAAIGKVVSIENKEDNRPVSNMGVKSRSGIIQAPPASQSRAALAVW